MVELGAILALVAVGALGGAAIGILGHFWLAPTAADERPTVVLGTVGGIGLVVAALAALGVL
jgi:hypothetical protein